MFQESIIKKALYHFDVGTIYRPTIEELEHKNYGCPKCKATLRLIVRKPVVNSLYICPDCDYFVPYKNILHDEETIQSKKEEIKGRAIGASNIGKSIIVNNWKLKDDKGKPVLEGKKYTLPNNIEAYAIGGNPIEEEVYFQEAGSYKTLKYDVKRLNFKWNQ